MSPALLLAALLLAQPAGDAGAVAEARLAAALPAAPCPDRACAAREIATLVQLDQLPSGLEVNEELPWYIPFDSSSVAVVPLTT